jgi:hypothetical protein
MAECITADDAKQNNNNHLKKNKKVVAGNAARSVAQSAFNIGSFPS